MSLRVGVVSHPASANVRLPARHSDVHTLSQFAVSLQQRGCQVQWVTSTTTAEVLLESTSLVRTDLDDLPPTCRYVLPSQPYRLAGVQLFCVEAEVWERADLHTRLYTFLCLLHREQPYDVLHAWGGLAAAYLTVYTARFLGLPSVVSYRDRDVTDTAAHGFMWQWVAQHVSMAIVDRQADREHLLSHSALVREHIRVIQAASPTIAPTVMTLYRRLHAG